MRLWIKIQIVWILVAALAVSSLAQTPVPATASQRAPVAEPKEANTVEVPTRDASGNVAQPQNAAPHSKPPVQAKKKGGKAKWIVIGAVAGAAVVIGAVFAARLNNEGYF